MTQAAKEDDLMFGTLDSWLLYKLNGGCQHVTEASNAISTGMNQYLLLFYTLVASLSFG